MTKKEEVQANVVEIIEETLGVSVSKVISEASFQYDLKVNYIKLVELIMLFEEEFNLEISDEERDRMKTVGEAVEFVYSQVA